MPTALVGSYFARKLTAGNKVNVLRRTAYLVPAALPMYRRRELIAPVALFKRATWAKWGDPSFHFMKERFALLKSGLCSFLKRNWKTGHKKLYHTFWLCFNKEKESNSLFIALLALLKRATRGNRSFKKSKKSDSLFEKEQKIDFFLSKNEWFTRKNKEQMSNPGNMRNIQFCTVINWIWIGWTEGVGLVEL